MSSSAPDDTTLTEEQQSDVARIVSAFKESWRKAAKKWGIDRLPYSRHFDDLVKTKVKSTDAEYVRAVSQEAFRQILMLRKRGEFAGKGPRPDLAPQPWKTQDSDRVPLSKAMAKNKTAKPKRKSA